MNFIITTEHYQRPIRLGEYSYDEEGNKMFGFVVFLFSETVIFLSFFAGYILYKTSVIHWLPPGVSGLEINLSGINTLVLISSSGVIFLAEKFLNRHHLMGFRLFLIATIAMGSYFLVGQAIEWNNLDFGFTSGVFGGMFYLLTGFHGLHVFAGIILQAIILTRSFITENYETTYFEVNATFLFWYFVDVMWIILFILLYLWQ